MKTAFVWLLPFILICLVSCTGGGTAVPVELATGTASPAPTRTATQSATPTTTFNSYLQITAGIGEGLIIEESEIEFAYATGQVPFLPGSYIVYDTLTISGKDLNYQIWARSLADGSVVKLMDCEQCPIRITDLRTTTDSFGNWLVYAVEAPYDEEYKTVLVFDIIHQQTRQLTCRAEGGCDLRMFSGHWAVWAEDLPFLTVELSPSQWVTISGKVLESESWEHIFFSGEKLYFFDEDERCISPHSYMLTIGESGIDVEELPHVECLLGNTDQWFLGWSSFSEESKVAYLHTVQQGTDPESAVTLLSLTTCPASVIYTGDVAECTLAIDDLNLGLFHYYTGWLNDTSFIVDKPGGLMEGQKILLIDLNGKVTTLYQGNMIFYDESPDERWLLYTAGNDYGLIDLATGSFSTLPLPENTGYTAWLYVP